MKRTSKVSPRKALIKELDKWCSLYVRQRETRCVTCGSTQVLQCGHLITRRVYAVRWDLDNCHTQCASCNLKHEYRPEVYTRWFIKTYGLPKYEDLCRRSEKVRKFTEADLRELLDWFQKSVNRKEAYLQHKA